MPAVAHQLIGREQELKAILSLFETPGEVPAAAVLHGDAGIGKTALWLTALDTAPDHGYHVLSIRPGESETALSYAGLADMLGALADDVLPALPPVQRSALETALLLGEPDARADERAVRAACLAALRFLAAEQSICLAIDDLQWLDAASLAALRFSLARLERQPIAFLATVRGDPPEWLRRVLPDAVPGSIELGALTVGATYELLRARLGTTFPRPVLLRLWETSGGNPFFALELGAALRRRDSIPAPDDPLPIPSDLVELLRDRLRALGPFARHVLQVVAAVAEPTADLVEAAVGAESGAGLAEALDAGILELDGERLRFAHPLLGSAISLEQTPSARRSLHRRLAELASTDEERAPHLARATTSPSEEVARILDNAARSASARGAPTAAAELAEQALRLTPPELSDDVRRRRRAAAQCHDTAGDTARATTLLEEALAEAAPGRERAELLIGLAGIHAGRRTPEALYREALREAGGEPSLEAIIHIDLARLMRWGEGIEPGVFHADLAAEAARRSGDAALESRALALQASWALRAGRGLERAQLEEAIARERALSGWPLERGVTELVAHELIWAVELEPARRLLLELCDLHESRGDAEREGRANWNLALLEWRAGNWDEAERRAVTSTELRAQVGREEITLDFPTALIDACRGRIDETRQRSSLAIARGEAAGVRIEQSGHEAVLGFVELSVGDPATALPHLRRAYELRNAFMLEPGMRLELGDYLEALIATDELEEADRVLTRWEARAAQVDRAWALAILARCRGLLVAADGDLTNALGSFEQALEHHARTTDPFQCARTLLARGRTERRAKKRAAARETLEDALARFEALGAPLWAEQTRAELARIGGRAPSRGDLTEAEHRIALLVAESHTNREVAAALFLTEHSVETALTRIYRKLGVRSRTELTRRLAGRS